MPNDRLLRTTLVSNAAISVAWGLTAAAGAPLLDAPLGIPAPVLVTVGLATVVAGALFAVFGRRESLRPAEGRLAAIGDAVFGLGLVLAAVFAPDFTTLGRWVVGMSGALVLDIALVEHLGVRRLTAGATRRPGRSRAEARPART